MKIDKDFFKETLIFIAASIVIILITEIIVGG